MKYTRMLDMNMVPEWRNQYLDYRGLDAILNKAIESKNMRSRQKGIDLYFELIKFNQKFASYFNRECQAQLNKINAFHKEKLIEMNGKYRNLQDQLEQVLSSPIYREIRPDLSIQDSDTVASISDLYRNLKHRMGNKANSDSPSNSLTFPNQLRPNLSNVFSTAKRLSIAPFVNDGMQMPIRERLNSMAKRLSISIANTTQKLGTSQLNLLSNGQTHLPMNSGEIGRSQNSNIFLDDDLGDSRVYFNVLSNSASQSRKKMIASYKKKIAQLKFAFKELYFNLVLFESYTQLNYTGFEQVLRKHDRLFASTLGRKFYQEHVQTADFYNNLQAIDGLIENVEHVYTLHFENGNRRKAIEKLEVPEDIYKQSSPIMDFRAGYELGTFAILFVLVILVGLYSNTAYDWRTIFRLYRSPLVLMIFLFQSGISIIIWKHYRINHVLIFELNPRDNLSSHHFIEFGSVLGIIWCISVIMFLLSAQLDIKPSLCPLVVVIIVVGYLFNPTATGHHRARFWLLRILGRIFTAPLHPVKFADFWIADQLVSIVPLFLDLEFLGCFYTTGDVLSVTHLSPDYASRCVTRNPLDLLVRTIVAALPAWFRCAQCLRRWRDENWLRIHLANAGKYGCMVVVVILSSISQYKKSSFELDTMRMIWMVAAIFTSSLTAYWDVIYDFGLFSTYDKNDHDISNPTRPRVIASGSFNGSVASEDCDEIHYLKINKNNRTHYPFLRKELVYPPWVYYFAIIEDWILRFGWIVTISLTEFSGIEAGLAVSLLAPMEMFRRFVWNCIRLENEQLNNCGMFRAVRDIPIEVVAHIDESNLEKVIMMMDSKDGPSMRNRLMKRRTLRPDGSAYLVLRPPEMEDSDRGNERI